MGLDTSHGCWHGPYSQFSRWRMWLAKQAGIPLGLMEGFGAWVWDGNELDRNELWNTLYQLSGDNTCFWDTLRAVRDLGRPISWDVINEPLVKLLHHSDCDGRIRWWDCKAIAIRLGKILRSAKDDTEYPHYEDGPRAGEPIWTDWREGRGIYDGNVPATKRFIVGLLKAWHERKDVIFR